MSHNDGLPQTEGFPPILCLTGIDGCGKSTHIRRLGKHLQDRYGILVPQLHVWEISQNPRFKTHPFISDQTAVHKYLGLLHGGPRALFMFHGLLESLELTRMANPKLILANGYWYKYAFTEALHNTGIDWLLAIASCFPPPKLTVMLDLPPESAWKRKPSVTPYECGFQTPGESTFVAFQSRLRNMFLRQAGREGWRIVSADRSENDVSNEIVQLVENEVNPDGRSAL
ncbi:hypothetical protein AUK22_06520 [bacterium CG2_30_54_10]|nr:MAG: hypothetical protein AUK22_06520 [bacterium CG2_30_54_10]